jgi:hypothetical protein
MPNVMEAKRVPIIAAAIRRKTVRGAGTLPQRPSKEED